MTNHEAKIYLAEQLPERIAKYSTGIVCCEVDDVEITRLGMVYGDWLFGWKETKREVLETEWQQIALWVEEKMTDEQSDKYRPKLFDLTLSNKYPYGWARGYLSASYTTRATAMKESGL